MKQAILITAYKDLSQLVAIATFFGEGFAVYIHIDQKTILSSAILQELNALDNVALVSQRYRVNWGGRNHLLAILHLIEAALQDKEVFMAHLITGQDIPIKTKKAFVSYFTANKNRDFLENFTMPADCWNKGGMDRLEYYNFYDSLNAKKHHHWIKRIVALQEKLGVKRRFSNASPQLYAGSTYWSLTRKTLTYVMEYTKTAPALLKRMKHTFCAEEVYFQTIVMNASLKDSVVGDNQRFILWKEKHGSTPGILDEDDLESLKQSKAFFARKMDVKISKRLLQDIQTSLLNE